ncbi:MAG: phosphoribosyltransferase family protein, partial [Mycobacteriales bacterium]
MSVVRIVAEPRTEFGKGGARRTRRAGKVPAVVYGHGTKPRHIALPGHDLMMALKTPNVLLNVEIDGKSELTLPKAVQRDPMVPNQVVANKVVGEVEGRTCVIVDDMIDTGGTIVKAADALFAAGAR